MKHTDTNSSASFQRLFDLSGDPMCVVGSDGRFERVNSALQRALGPAASDLLGTSFIDYLHDEDRIRVRDLLSALAQEGKSPTPFDARLCARDGSLRWIEWRGAGDGSQGSIYLVGRDVSRRKTTERALHREEDFVTLLQIATVAANEASSIEEALEIVIAAICARRNLPLGHAYLVTEPGVLASSGIWHMQQAQRFAPLIEASEASTFRLGEGLPGSVLKAGRPLWIDVATAPNFPRREAALSCGVRAAFAFPLSLGSEVLGVLEFFSSDALEPDEGLLEVMKHVGAQLGRVAERSRAQDALVDSGERARRIMETTNDAFVGMDMQGFITDWNEKAESMFGWARDEAVGRSLTKTIIPPRLRAAHEKAVARYLDSGNQTIMNRCIELPALHRDGHEIPIELTVWPLVQRDGLTFNAFLRDVTERKVAEEEISRTSDFAQTVVSSTIDGVFAFDTTMKITEWNQAMEEITGVPRSKALGRNSSEMFPSLEGGDEREELFRAVLGGRAAGFSNRAYVRPDTGQGSFYDGNLAPLCGIDGEVVGGVAVLHDITERKLLEDGLRATSERISNAFSHTFNNGLIGMAMVSLDGRMEQVNPALCSLLGYSEEELLATVTKTVTHEDDRSAESAQMESILSGAISSYQIEKRLLHSSGSAVWILLVASAVTDASGHPLYLIHQVADITERKRAEERLTHQTLHDSLTGLPNRTLLLDRLEQALARSQRWTSPLAVMFVDFDRFKVINDSLGHEAGDKALLAIARRLERMLRPSDTVARFGGDEFVILCEAVESLAQAREIATRIAEAVADPIQLGDTQAVLSASVGIALSTSPLDPPETLVRDADAAMHKAKEKGRGRHEVFDDTLRHGVVQRLQIENELRSALENGELRLYYQPQVNLSERRIVGAEALIRWEHPKRGLLAPAEFILVAEESGLIVDIDAWVVQQACRTLERWADRGWDSLSLSVNVSAQSLSSPEFGGLVRAGLEASGNPCCLCLEITERVFMGVGHSTMETISGLRELGVELALDDFGTGYSSLSYLKRFPIDVLKVDRSFVQGLGHDSGDSAITATVITLAHNMDLEAIAEGVETEEQLDQLRELGCDIVQGFHCGRPQPREELERALAA